MGKNAALVDCSSSLELEVCGLDCKAESPTLVQDWPGLSVPESLTSAPCSPLCPSRIKESSGWQQVFTSPYLDWTIERVALNAKVVGGPHGDKDKMVAVASESSIILWSIQDGGSGSEIGTYHYLVCFFFCVCV